MATAHERATASTDQRSVTILGAALIGLYVLLPLDRGFPMVPLFRWHLNSAIAATLAVMLILIVKSRGAVLSYLREPYSMLQAVYTCTLVAGALRAPSIPSAVHWAILYYCTFVVNYAILRHVISVQSGERLSKAVVALGVAAAAVSIVQSFGIHLPMYDAWFQNYFSTPPADYALSTTRAHGTMNNPIVYGFLMALVVPYALSLKNRPARATALFTLMFAAALSGSRTTLFILVVFVAGAVVVFRWRAVRALPAVAFGVVLLMVALAWLTPFQRSSRLTLLSERITTLAGPNATFTADQIAKINAAEPEVQANASGVLGVSLRRGVIRECIREMVQEWGPLTWMFGRGSFTAASVGTRIQPWYNTVDNVYLSTLYERGLLGLALFTVAFLSILLTSWRASVVTVHWFSPLALAVAGLSFNWDAYSMFNIVAVGSMALAMSHHEDQRAATEAATLTPGGAAPRVAILTNVLPSYREGFYDRLFSRIDIVTTVYCQASVPGTNVRPIHTRYPGRVKLVKSIGWRGEALVWQFTPWRSVLFGFDVVFVEGNPRVLSHALTATVLRLLRRNVVCWTMGHSYRANRLTERVRLFWTRMFDRIFVYTDAEVGYLRNHGFAIHEITAMNNGLDQKAIDSVITAWNEPRLQEWRDGHSLSNRTVILSSARLEPKNRFEQVIAALPAILAQHDDAIWCVIGSGTEEQRLKALARDAGVTNHVRFVGELYEERSLAPWFLSAAVLVHPGAIGLTMLHAFGYGVPVVTHSNAAHHGPEFAAFDEGLCGRSYPENDTQRLASTVVELLKDEAARQSMKRHVQSVARTRFNTDVMVERFVAAATSALRPRTRAGLGQG